MSQRLIFHVDVNSAFLSWEAARRVKRGEPDLRLIPSAIGGERDTRSGVILAKSLPAGKLGIKTGEPVGMALRKCPDLVLAKPDFSLYHKSSAAFIDICRDFAPVVEQYSIDECFLDMTGTHLIYPDPVAAAHMLRRRIRDTLGFTVNVGIGSNKLLAKMAGDFEKPDKVHTLFYSEVPKKLWPLPVRDLIGVGAATAQKLERSCFKTVGDIARVDLDVLQAIVGKKLGEYLHRCAVGADESPVLSKPEDAKGYSMSTTLEENVVNLPTADRILLALTDHVAARMRADGAKAFGVSVSVRTLDFKTRSHQRKLSNPTDITDDIYRLATVLLREMWDGMTPLRLLGVSLFEVTNEQSEQLSFFDEEDKSRKRTIDKTVDAIRDRFGIEGIIRAAALETPREVGKKYKNQHKE